MTFTPIKRTVLDNHHITLQDHFGDALTIVNAARVSFGTEHQTLTKNDRGLIKFLFKHKHYSPLRQVFFRFKMELSEVIMRQLLKHTIGADWFSPSPSNNLAWNEISGRYKPVEEYYRPTVWRAQSKDNKQCSEGLVDEQTTEQAQLLYDQTMDIIKENYAKLVELGVAKEQARLILPLSQITQSCWTVSLQAILNFIELRDKPDSQWEIQEVARAIKELVKEAVPDIYEIWEEVREEMKNEK